MNATIEAQTAPAIASFTPEVGPPMRRRRSTARIDRYGGQFTLTRAQSITLKTFHDVTCAEGALTFDGTDWFTSNAAKYIFDGPPSFTSVAGSVFRATVNLIKMP